MISQQEGTTARPGKNQTFQSMTMASCHLFALAQALMTALKVILGKSDIGAQKWDAMGIWRFPKMGGPLVFINFKRIVHSLPSSYWGTPMYGTPHIANQIG